MGKLTGYLKILGGKKYKLLDGKITDLSLTSPENDFFQKVRSTIYDHLDDSTFGVDQLCHLMAMSNSQIYRKLKSQTGLSGHELIQGIRIS